MRFLTAQILIRDLRINRTYISHLFQVGELTGLRDPGIPKCNELVSLPTSAPRLSLRMKFTRNLQITPISRPMTNKYNSYKLDSMISLRNCIHLVLYPINRSIFFDKTFQQFDFFESKNILSKSAFL